MESSFTTLLSLKQPITLHIQGYTNMNLLFFLPVSLVAFLHSSPSSASLHLVINQLKHWTTSWVRRTWRKKLGYRKPLRRLTLHLLPFLHLREMHMRTRLFWSQVLRLVL